MPNDGVGGLGTGDGLEHQVHGRVARQRLHLGGDVGEDADLGGNAVAFANAVEHPENRLHGAHVVAGGIDADDGVAAAVGEAVEDAGGDALKIVGGMVGLQARGDAPGESDGGAEVRDHAAFRAYGDQVLEAHDFGDGGRHFRGEAGRQSGEALAGGLLAEQPVAQFADGQVRDGRERGGIVGIEDEAGDFVALVRDERLGQNGFQGHVGKLHLRPCALFGGGGGDARQLVAGTRGRSLCE